MPLFRLLQNCFVKPSIVNWNSLQDSNISPMEIFAHKHTLTPQALTYNKSQNNCLKRDTFPEEGQYQFQRSISHRSFFDPTSFSTDTSKECRSVRI